jgi:hypothetical protein
VVTGDLEVADVHGEHLALVRPPIVDVVARQLRDTLATLDVPLRSRPAPHAAALGRTAPSPISR